jgi:hypothetical protein
MFLRNALARFRRARNNHTGGSPSVTIGDELITVRPLGIEDTIRVAMLLAPYLAKFQNHLPRIATAVAGDRLRLLGERSTLRAFVAAMMDDTDRLPGDVVKMLALFLGREPGWVAENATAHQLVAAIPAIDEANDLARLIHSTGMLGFVPGEDHG